MNFKTETDEKGTIIRLCEERLDANNSEEFKKLLNLAFEKGAGNVIVDMKDVRFIDSSGLGALVSGFKNASTRHGTLKVAAIHGQVRSMFELTRLHRAFDIYPSAEEALETLYAEKEER